MSISNNTIITSAGLDLATSAHDSGPLIAIKYFVPSYDYRIDPNMYTDSIDVLELSASMSADDTEPYGEIIYNIDADNHIYTLSDSTNFIVSGGTETNHTSYYTVENPLVTDKYKVNLYDGSALSNYYSGTEAVYDSNDYPNAWKITGFDTVSGDNSVPSEVISGNSRFFDVTDYYPVSEDSGYIKGSWKCRLSKNIGNVKFNKIGLYVVQLDSNGNESSAPVLFAEASLSETITKTNFGNDGFDDIVIDVQLQLVSLPADFSDVFYSTSGDYWSRTVGGLYYPDKIGIGTFEDGVEEPDGQLEVKSITKQLTLTYDTDNKVYFNVGINDTSATQLKLTSKSTTNGLLDINFNNKANLTDIHELSVGNLSAKLNSRDIILKNSLVPEATNNLGLGDYGLDFRQIYSKRLYSTNKSIETNSTLLPKGTIDLGNSASKWNNVYANNINASTSIVTKDLTATNINSDKLTINELTTSSIILKNKTLGYWIVDYFATDSNGLIQATDPKHFAFFNGDGRILEITKSGNKTIRYSIMNKIAFVNVDVDIDTAYFNTDFIYMFFGLDELKPYTDIRGLAIYSANYSNQTTPTDKQYSVFNTFFNTLGNTSFPEDEKSEFMPCFKLSYPADIQNTGSVSLHINLIYEIV